MIFRIAKLVSDAHDLFLYRRDEGGFTGWMKTRFGCSSSNAYAAAFAREENSHDFNIGCTGYPEALAFVLA